MAGSPIHRLRDIAGFDIDDVARRAGADPAVLRLENLDTDLRPPASALAATRHALEDDDANSYLPFEGTSELRTAIAARLGGQTGHEYAAGQVVVTSGGTEGMLDALLATTNPADEVIVTDPTYAGIISRIRLAGGVTRFVPLVPDQDGWCLDLDALRQAVRSNTRSMVLMSPSMPSGGVLSGEDWEVVAQLCRDANLWLLYDAAMERILFDDQRPIHPASLPGMVDRTLTIGSVSKEFRMIGWRIGWVVGPPSVMRDVLRVHMYNVVTASGIAQAGATAALAEPEQQFERCRREWQQRRDVLLDQLAGLPAVRPSGGWSLLLDVGAMDLDSATAAALLLQGGKIAATPMRSWGSRLADRYVRLVYSNEPQDRLRTVRERLRAALRF